jgi:hypothetical protein
MYEIHWHYNNEEFYQCTVTPIVVYREDILPDCTKVSISAIDSQGNYFQGCPEDYFATEALAWESVRKAIKENIACNKKIIKNMRYQTSKLIDYLHTLGD